MSDYWGPMRIRGTSFGDTVVEVAFTYGSSASDSPYGGGNLAANIAHLISVANSALSTSGLDIVIQDVGQYSVGDDSENIIS